MTHDEGNRPWLCVRLPISVICLAHPTVHAKMYCLSHLSVHSLMFCSLSVVIFRLYSPFYTKHFKCCSVYLLDYYIPSFAFTQLSNTHHNTLSWILRTGEKKKKNSCTHKYLPTHISTPSHTHHTTAAATQCCSIYINTTITNTVFYSPQHITQHSNSPQLYNQKVNTTQHNIPLITALYNQQLCAAQQ